MSLIFFIFFVTYFFLLRVPTIQAVGYPFDIIKTRIQANPNSSTASIYGTGLQLVKEANGNVMRGLYKGFGLKLVRAIPASMIGFTTYEWVAAQLRQQKTQK
jgi:solute carrier family 25 carnitine/acylcarnitine transporter 20/29